MVLVSIITVSFNSVNTISKTIESVISQSYSNIEYIIIDGGSTDGTVDHIRNYESFLTYWISESDDGIYHAMNKGIAQCKGELIGIINSDDWYEPDAIKCVVDEFLSNQDKKIFHGDRNDIDELGNKKLRRFNPSVTKLKYFGMTYNHPSFFVKREVYKDFIFNQNLRALADYQFILSVYLKHPDWIHYIPVPYVNYRIDGYSSRISLFKNLNEGFNARKSAGLGWFENIVSYISKLLIRFLQELINYVRKI
jgi:glycosyltransferase involved in cell wall biosynthesis